MKIFGIAIPVIVIATVTFASTQIPPLTVHLVPHSHDDAGWIRTIDEYYFDSVKQIYDNVMASLILDSKRRFIIVEQIFFSRWYSNALKQQKADFLRILARGQVEFVMGGWVMNDEATVTHTAMVDQLSHGYSFIQNTFGISPKHAFQIDPFGHAASSAYLFPSMGFESVILNRIHYMDKKDRKDSQRMEFIWKYHENATTGILAHILDNHYSSPPGFDFDHNDGITNEKDLAIKSEWLVEHWIERSKSYPSSANFLQLVGDDFRWIKAHKCFTNWEKIIRFINGNSLRFGVNVRFSTLNEYFEARNNEKHPPVLSEYTGDFFPYADNKESYWTGYFTSKPHLKWLVRSNENFKRAVEMTSVLRLLEDTSLDNDHLKHFKSTLKFIRSIDAEVQHHDAVTGTSKEYVTQAYMNDLLRSRHISSELLSSHFRYFLHSEEPYSINHDAISGLREGQEVEIAVMNTNWHRFQIIEIPVHTDNILVFDIKDDKITSQILPSDPTLNLKSPSPYTLVFEVRLNHGQIGRYFLKYGKNKESETTRKLIPRNFSSFDIHNMNVKALFSPSNDHLYDIFISYGDAHFKLSPRLLAYQSYSGEGQASGAYIFRTESDAKPIEDETEVYKMEILEGPLIVEFRVAYANGYRISYRLYQSHGYFSESLEIRQSIGPLPVDTEVVFRIQGDSKMGSCGLYTDAAGIFMVNRPVRNHENIAGNVYPATVMGSLTCGDRALSVLTDRSVGIASQKDGTMEIMLHRRTSRDDWRGVGEALDDVSVINPVLNLFYTEKSEMGNVLTRYGQVKRYPPIVMFGLPHEKIANRSNMELKWLNGMINPSLVDSLQLHLSVRETPGQENQLSVLLRLHDIKSTKEAIAYFEEIRGNKSLKYCKKVYLNAAPKVRHAKLIHQDETSDGDGHEVVETDDLITAFLASFE